MLTINRRLESNVKIGRLSVHPRNSRRGDVDVIGASIDALGWFGVIVAQLSTGHILAGNHRYLAAVAAGATTVPVAWVDVDDATALRIMVSDNRSSDIATNDADALAAMLTELRDADLLDGTGYSDDDLSELLDAAASGSGGGDAGVSDEAWHTLTFAIPDSVHELFTRAYERIEVECDGLHGDGNVARGQVLESLVAEYLAGAS